jgi:hypothetical protein
MEVIKKTIHLITTTGTTGGTWSTKIILPDGFYTNPTNVYIGWTGATGGTGYTYIPNTGVTYNFKILLTQEIDNVDFLSTYELDDGFDYIQLSGATSAITEQNIVKFMSILTGGTTFAASGLVSAYSNGNISGTTINHHKTTGETTYYIPNSIYNVVIGGATSRLSELRKYVISGFTLMYFSGGTYFKDGVDYIYSIENQKMTYYIGGIKYVDILSGATSGTTFRFTTLGVTNPNFTNKPIYKDPTKENIISQPKIDDDVFIVRQELSAFENNYKLEYIKTLNDLLTYAGGNYFNIINNT